MIAGVVWDLVGQASSPSPSPFVSPPPPGPGIPELVVGAILALVGARSLVKWLGGGFEPATPRDRVLYSIYVGARAGWWFALAGFFFGLGLVEEPVDFLWFMMVPLTLAGLQLITGVVLSHGGSPDEGTSAR
jgi:hypothetical protein